MLVGRTVEQVMEETTRSEVKQALAARGRSEEKSGTASQFVSGELLFFWGHDGGRIGGSPHFSLLHDFRHGLLAQKPAPGAKGIAASSSGQLRAFRSEPAAGPADWLPNRFS